MPASLTRLTRWFGVLLTLACLGFVAWRVMQLAPRLASIAAWPSVLSSAGLAILIYSAGGMLLAVAWWLLLRALANQTIAPSSAVGGHLRAQIAKYAPGNVFHFAARHIHARRQGLDHLQVATAAVAESLLLVAVAVSLSIAVPALAIPDALQWLAPWRWLMVVGLFALFAVFYLLRFRGRIPAGGRAWHAGIGGTLGAMACYVSFFVLAATAFRCLLESSAMDALALVPTIAICWLGGFLVVGSPGGLGVREALLVGLLGPALGEAPALYAALAFRGVTILADALLFLIGLLIARHAR